MNILELLKNEKVEWKKLGEVSDIFKGKQFNKSDMLEIGKYPVVNGGVLPSGYADKFNFSENTITVSQGGASAGFVNFIDKKFWMGAHAFAVLPKKEILSIYSYQYNSFNRFLFHILKMNQSYLQDSKTGAGIPSVSKDELANIEVPLMSKKTLEKIAETLDNFTDYVTELQAELQYRTLQYNHYRDFLLNEEYLRKRANNLKQVAAMETVKQIPLEEIVDIVVGGDVPKDNFSPIQRGKYKIPIMSNGVKEKAVYGYTDRARVDKKSVTVSARGTIGYVSYMEEPYYPIVRLICLIPKKEIEAKYLYYLLQKEKLEHKETGIPSLTADMIKNKTLQVPPLEIQNKVIVILDKFQSLLSDTQGLLPQEIEQRQKQYEYYREKLLTFDTGDKTIFTDRQTDRQTDRHKLY